jgi:hypothetical protein
VRPGREHDTTALRHHDVLPLLTAWTDDDLRVLGDLGYEGEQATITVAFKKPKNEAIFGEGDPPPIQRPEWRFSWGTWAEGN